MTLCWGEPPEHSHTDRLLTGVLSAWKLLSCSLIFLLQSCQSLWRKPVILSHSWSSSALLAMWKVHFGNLILSTLRKKFLFWGSKYSGFTHHQNNAREWKILLSLSSTCSLWDLQFSVSLFKNGVGGQSRFFLFKFLPVLWALRCLFDTMN